MPTPRKRCFGVCWGCFWIFLADLGFSLSVEIWSGRGGDVALLGTKPGHHWFNLLHDDWKRKKWKIALYLCSIVYYQYIYYTLYFNVRPTANPLIFVSCVVGSLFFVFKIVSFSFLFFYIHTWCVQSSWCGTSSLARTQSSMVFVWWTRPGVLFLSAVYFPLE